MYFTKSQFIMTNNTASLINMVVNLSPSAFPQSLVMTSFQSELLLSNFSLSNENVSLLATNFTEHVDFERCFLEDNLQQLLCENVAAEVTFNCPFPASGFNISGMDAFTTTKVVQLGATGVAFIVSLVGNLLVVIAAPFDVTLRSPVNLFLVNLSLADILVSVFCLWDNAFRSMFYNYMFGPVGCKVGGFIHMACLFVSVLTLAGIALDRVYAVLLPFKARHTPPRPKWVIGAIWALSVAVAAPFSALREYRVYKWQDFTEIQCTYSRGRGYYTPDEANTCKFGTNYVNTYHLLVTILLFFIPVIVILLAYLLIILKLWKNQSFIENSRVISRVHINAKKKVVRLALVVLTAFLVCWTPLQALILISVFEGDQHRVLSQDRYAFWIYFVAYTNSALNPIIYGGFSKSYRATLLRLFRRGRRRKTPSMTAGRSRGTVTLTIPQKSEGPLLRQRPSLGRLVAAPLASLNNHKKRGSFPGPRADLNCKEGDNVIMDPRLGARETTEIIQMEFNSEVRHKSQKETKRTNKKSARNSILKILPSSKSKKGLLSPSKKFSKSSVASDSRSLNDHVSILPTEVAKDLNHCSFEGDHETQQANNLFQLANLEKGYGH